VSRPHPQPDRDSAPWWEGVARHELRFQRCAECGRYRWPPRALCNDCGSLEWTWVAASGRGVVASWTVTHRSPAPEVPAPYVVVLVRAEEQDDLFLPGNYEGPSDGSDLVIGAPVVVGFEDLGVEDGTPAAILRWRRTD
jgi:uncharacterized OB-fold protein